MENTNPIMKKIDAGELIAATTKLPTVRINRETFLRSQFDKIYSEEMVSRVVESGPYEAGVPQKVITKLAQSTIKQETMVTSLTSAAAGIPGGFALLATVPADAIQVHGAMLRLSQKLAYLYGWTELLPEKGDTIDEETKNVLLLFVGTMYGVSSATGGLAKISTSYSVHLAKTLPTKALTQGAIYPIVKKVARALGIQMTKTIYGRGVAKLVPLAGAVISGGITFYSFRGMSRRLQTHLAKLHAQKVRSSSKPAVLKDSK
jgi:hypothetical protein